MAVITLTLFGRATAFYTMLNPLLIQNVKNEIAIAIADIGKKHGVTLQVKNGGSYYPEHCTIKVEMTMLGESGEKVSVEALNFTKMARSYGFEPSDLGKEFSIGGSSYKICGLKTRAHKMPILALQVGTGRRFKFMVNSVLMALGRKTNTFNAMNF